MEAEPRNQRIQVCISKSERAAIRKRGLRKYAGLLDNDSAIARQMLLDDCEEELAEIRRDAARKA